MSQETGNVLLHGQLQDGLRYEIMKAPAVSDVQSYNELCLVSQNEEKHLLELNKRLQYPQPSTPHFVLHKGLTHPMVLQGEGHVMHNHFRREVIVKARNATSVEYLVICSETANSRTGDQRVPCHPDSLLTKELWSIRTEDKPKHPSMKTLTHSCILRKKTRQFHW